MRADERFKRLTDVTPVVNPLFIEASLKFSQVRQSASNAISAN
jgi:hypothetical protein